MELLCRILCVLLICGVASAFSVSGNTILDKNGNPVLLRGMNRPSFEWQVDGQYTSLSDYTLMKSWGANVIRLCMNQCFWLKQANVYQANIQQQIDWIKSLGMGVILDLHWSNQGNDNTACNQQNMADSQSLTFWKQVAAKYKNDNEIMFELYNEPRDVSWNTWRNGGNEGFAVVGMQTLYDGIRAAGANNIIIVGGLDWAFDLSQINQYALTGNNIVYCTHPYNYAGKLPQNWDNAFGYLTATYPVIATEFGQYCADDGYVQEFINYANRKSISYMGWAWWAEGCAFPSLIADWSGTPTSVGAIVKYDLQNTQKIPGNTSTIPHPTTGSSSSSSSSSTTGSVVPANDLKVYIDDLANGYEDYSWAEPRTKIDTSLKRSGSASYSWTPNEFQAVYFFKKGAVNTRAYKGVEFYIHGGTTGNQKIKFNVVKLNGANSDKYGPDNFVSTYIGSEIKANAWTRGYVDFSTFPADSYDGFWFQNSGTTGGKVYLDDVTLIGAASATTASGSSATTSASSTSAASTSAASTSAASTSAASTSAASTSAASTSAASTSSATTSSATTSSASTSAASTSSASTSSASTSAATSSAATTSAATTSSATTSKPSTTSSAATTSAATTSSATTSKPSTTSSSATTSKPSTTSSSATTSSTTATTAATTSSASSTTKSSTTAASSTTSNPFSTTSTPSSTTSTPSSTTSVAATTSVATTSNSTSSSNSTVSPTTRPCSVGSLGCSCTVGGGCDADLACFSGVCQQEDDRILGSGASSVHFTLFFIGVSFVVTLLL